MAFSLDTPSYALIEGMLCRLNRKGSVVRRHLPMGLAVEEFLVHEDRIFVRESAEGVLLGMTNLYCLDTDLRMIWLAEAPGGDDAYAGPLELDGAALTSPTRSGRRLTLSLETGSPVAAGSQVLQNT